jgi:hypothetical protein
MGGGGDGMSAERLGPSPREQLPEAKKPGIVSRFKRALPQFGTGNKLVPVVAGVGAVDSFNPPDTTDREQRPNVLARTNTPNSVREGSGTRDLPREVGEINRRNSAAVDVAPAEPQVPVGDQDERSGTKEHRKSPKLTSEKAKKKIGIKTRVGLATLAVAGGVEATGAIIHELNNDEKASTKTILGDLMWWDFDNSIQEDIKRIANRENPKVKEGSLIPSEPVEWSTELPPEQIHNFAETPSIHIVEERDKSYISPELQEKARAAGYEIIYQHDPNDTTGRTVVTRGRQLSNNDWSEEDNGFGRAGSQIRGIFEAWVSNPKDPSQDESVYALLKNPISGENMLVRVELKSFDPSNPIRPTWFQVDDLYNGPEEIQRRSREVGMRKGQELSSGGLPSPGEPPLKRPPKATDYPTMNNLLRRQGVDLNEIAQAGDYLVGRMQTAGVDREADRYIYRADENGVPRVGILTVRRFGGGDQWNSELSAPQGKNLVKK